MVGSCLIFTEKGWAEVLRGATHPDAMGVARGHGRTSRFRQNMMVLMSLMSWGS